MLVVRSPQLQALSKALDQSFEEGLAADLTRFWPETCAELGADGVRARVATGVERARSYGLDARGDIARYLSTMFALGPGFDEDERYPWAGPILRARIVGKVKMDKICARAAEALARGGDEGA